MSDNISADHLRLLLDRIDRLEEEKKGIADDIKDVYAEAKARGFDVKTMRAIRRLRNMEKHHREEAEALLETYKAALGMDMFAGHDGRSEARKQSDRPSRIDMEALARKAAEKMGGDFSIVNGIPVVTIKVGAAAGSDDTSENPDRLDDAGEASPPKPPGEITYEDAVRLVVDHKKASVSWLQRQLRIGYNVAAAHMDRMEREGVVSKPSGTGARQVLRAA